jgi:glycosyl hydrolase family 43
MSVSAPDVEFRISVTGGKPVPLPTDRFSIRQNSAIWFGGSYYLYADVIPWNNPYHPASYDTSIHLFRSADAEHWEYLGEVIGKGRPGQWTANGIATPGACLFNGRIYVAYSVRGNRDGSGHRFIGVSVADHPTGPFRELPELRIVPGGVDYSRSSPTLLLDDPCLVGCNGSGTGPGDERLSIYYRRSLNDFGDSEERGRALEYGIHSRSVADLGGGWSDPHPVLAASEGKVVEVAEARWINGRLVLIILGYSEGEMNVYVSSDSLAFIPAVPHRLESYLDIFMPAACFRLPGLIQDPDGQVRHLTTPGDIDDQGHYTQWVYQIACR